VRDQVACGSCWAFATAEAIESQIAIQTGIQQPVSVNEIMDCTWENQNFGCQGGDPEWAFSSMMDNKTGIALEKDYPYLGVSGMCNKNSSTWGQGSQGTVTNCWHIEHTTKAVQEALYYFGPLAIGIAVTEDMLLYTDGVFNDTACTGASDDLVHAVLLTGWTRDDNGNLVWEVKNSWSEHWGDNGYVYIQGKDQEWNCGVTTDAVAVEVTLKSRQ
jgi:C1A family cysteine protease